MRKIKFIFSLVLIFAFCVVSFPARTNAQDYRLGLGRAWLRYDSDSAKIRIGAYGSGTVIPKLAREFNAALFDFNSAHFDWSTSTGLNLKEFINHDSVWSYRFTIMADTGDGEMIPRKERFYTLKKSTWFNNYSPYDFKWHYKSYISGSIAESDSVYAVNNAELVYSATDQALGSSWGQLHELILPLAGSYLVFINYDYEFDEDKPVTAVYDEIEVRLLRFPTTNLGSAKQKFQYHPFDYSTSFRGSASIVVAVTTYDEESLFLQGKCTDNSAGLKFIRSLSVTYLLVK